MMVKQGVELKQEWAAFIRTGDEKAFYQLYTHYYHYLSFVGFKKSADVVKVKNCISDLFLYLWEKREGLAAVKEHHNYIVTAFLRKLLRKESFDNMCSIDAYDLPDYTAVPSPESLYISRNTRDRISELLKAYLKQLPEKQRRLIYQKFYLGLSYKEISQVNGISINTVYNTIYKAVDKLKLLIGKEQLNLLSMALTALSIFFLFFFLH